MTSLPKVVISITEMLNIKPGQTASSHLLYSEKITRANGNTRASGNGGEIAHYDVDNETGWVNIGLMKVQYC